MVCSIQEFMEFLTKQILLLSEEEKRELRKVILKEFEKRKAS